MFDMQGYIIYVVLYFVIWLEFISESYFYVPTINKVFNNNKKYVLILKFFHNQVMIVSGVSGYGGVRTHSPPNMKCLFWDVKCPFLPIIPFENYNAFKSVLQVFS